MGEPDPEALGVGRVEALQAQCAHVEVLGRLVGLRVPRRVTCISPLSGLDPVVALGSRIATSRTMQPSPFSQRQGNAAKVTRLPVTSSIWPPTFSKPTMPCRGARGGTAPKREVVGGLAAGVLLVFLEHARDERARSAAGRSRCRAGGRAPGSRCRSPSPALPQPLAGLLVDARRVDEVLAAVAVVAVPAGVDDHDVARADLRASRSRGPRR